MALPVEGAAAAEDHRRPDTHDARAESVVEEWQSAIPGLLVSHGDAGEDEGLDQCHQDRESGLGLHFQLVPPAGQDHPGPAQRSRPCPE